MQTFFLPKNEVKYAVFKTVYSAPFFSFAFISTKYKCIVVQEYKYCTNSVVHKAVDRQMCCTV